MASILRRDTVFVLQMRLYYFMVYHYHHRVKMFAFRKKFDFVEFLKNKYEISVKLLQNLESVLTNMQA